MFRQTSVLTAGLAAIAMASPAMADRGRDDWDRSERNWRDDQRHNSNAYRKGYRDGKRADDRRDAASAYARGYRDGQRADNRYGYGNSRYAYGNSRYGNGWAGAPVYYGNSSWNRPGNQPAYWWGSNGRVHCRRSDGTTGLIVGAIAGGTLGNVIAAEGDKRLGSVIGGTLGAVLGNELARGNVRCG
jgi:hypothetical protein